MSRNMPTYLRTHRKRWALSQRELASLLTGCSAASSISRFELSKRQPGLEFALACELVFGQPVKDLFPSLYTDVEDTVMRNALRMHEHLADKSDPKSLTKLRLLEAILERAQGDQPGA